MKQILTSLLFQSSSYGLLLICSPLLMNAGSSCSKEQNSVQSKSIIPAAPVQHINYTMRSQPDDARTVDIKLTWYILSERIHDPISEDDTRVIASYCAYFRNCKNGIANRAPETATYIKNPNGYTLTPIIQSMACEKYLLSRVSLKYTTEKNGKKDEDLVHLDFDGTSPLVSKDPTNENLYMRILLSEVKTNSDL